MNRYLTTPIYYASGAPHLGHAYTTLVADCYKRFHELAGDDVLLITGTDEHGQKIERTAHTAGVPVAEFVDARSREFEALWRDIDVATDRFERTTSETHKQFATAFWERLAANGDIYLDTYEGLYCVECEQYFVDGDTCPVHRKPLERFREPSYFFRLSRYRDALIEHIESHPGFIVPVERRNEVLAFLRGNELRDLAVSRASTRWGVPVPGDADHVQYVWVDALTTYLSALSPDRYRDFASPEIQTWWQHATHFIGKDILTFHAIYWPALLLSAQLPLPKRLVVNGWLTVEGRKIAKSDPATVVNPVEITSKVGCDGLKLYLLKTVSLGQDIDFARDNLVEVVNADLANNVGNLFSRFVALADKHFGGQWRRGEPLTDTDEALLAAVGDCAKRVEVAFEAGNPSVGARAFVDAAAAINAWFQQQEPWKVTGRGRLATILWTVHHALADLTVLGTPFAPETLTKARQALCLGAPAWQQVGERRDTVLTQIMKPLYPRLDAVDLWQAAS